MAIKTFTSGEVLTAADTNTYLANSGLVYVTSTTFSTSTAITVDSCFDGTYAYRIFFQQTNSSSSGDLRLVWRDSGGDITTSTYYGSLWWVGTLANSGQNTFNGTAYAYLSTFSSTGPDHYAIIDISASSKWQSTIQSGGFEGAGLGRKFRTGGMQNENGSTITGFKIYPTAGNVTGSVTVYKYRTA